MLRNFDILNNFCINLFAIYALYDIIKFITYFLLTQTQPCISKQNTWHRVSDNSTGIGER